MNKLKQRWIAALRSGEYKQTIHVLAMGNTYCCWGVLCKMEGKLPVNVQTSRIPSTIAKKLFPVGLLISFNGIMPWHNITDFYANKNDAGTSFAEIADLLEADTRF